VKARLKALLLRTRDQVADVAERAAWTAGQTFVAVFTPTVIAAATGSIDVATARAAAISAGMAAGAAALAVVKGWIATLYGDGTAATRSSDGDVIDLSTLSDVGGREL